MSSPAQSSIALLVDYENVPRREAVGLDAILSQTSQEGTVVLRRAYANWAQFSSHKVLLRAAGFEMIDVASVNGKNSVDIKLVVDAMEIAFTKDYIDTFVIVSGDSDFVPLVIKLNELNRRAWLCIGDRKVSPTLSKFCFRMPALPKAAKSPAPKIGPTIPNNKPVPSTARPGVKLSPKQFETLQLAAHICDLVLVPPTPLAWLFSTVRALDSSFDQASCAGNGKRPHARIAQHLQSLGMIDFSFDAQLKNYVFSPCADFRLLPFPPDSHVHFRTAVEKLELHVASQKEKRFRLRPVGPLIRRELPDLAVSVPYAPVMQLDTASLNEPGSVSASMQLEFCFE